MRIDILDTLDHGDMKQFFIKANQYGYKLMGEEWRRSTSKMDTLHMKHLSF